MCSYRVSLIVGHESAGRRGAGGGVGGVGGGGGVGGVGADWTLFVRGGRGQDISRFVSKIVFTLHRSYTYPKRVIHEPPYEIRESGSGGFEVPIHIYIKHSSKIKLRYKLLLASGSQTFSHVFEDPPEPVRTCLIQGGAEVLTPDLIAEDEKIKTDDCLSRLSRKAFDKLTDLFEPIDSDINMEKFSKAASDPDRASEERLKRKHHETLAADSKKRRPEDRKKKEDDEQVKEASADVKKSIFNKGVNGVRVRNASKSVRSDVKSAKRTCESDKAEAFVVDGLKKACKLVEMSSSEIDLVSNLYVSLSRYDKNPSKDTLKLPPFSDPVYQPPDLPPSLRGLLAETNDSYVLR